MSVQRPLVAQHDVDLHQFFSQGPRALRRSWILATTLGELLGFLAPAVVGVLTFDLNPAATVPLMMLAGLVEGTVLGAAQSFVLRREFLGFSRTAWIVATALGAATAWLAGMLPSSFAGTWTEWPLWLSVPLGLLLGTVVLVSIGLTQSLVLRRHVTRSRSWVPVNAAAWAVGLGLLLGIGMPLWHEGQPVVLVVLIGLLGALAMAVTVAVVTGLWLVRLVCPRDGRTRTRPAPAGVPQGDWTALGAATDEFRVFDPTALDHLPEPVQRWLRHAVNPGATLLSGAETEWSGHIRFGGTWRAFCSRQRITVRGGYVWSARSRWLGLPVTGFDRFTRGQGEMRWRLPLRLRLMAQTGDEVTRSSAGRHAAELLATIPVVALDPSVRWEAVDLRHATAHLTVDGEDQAVTISVDPVGRLRGLELDRWGSPPRTPYGPYRFGALLDEERRFDSYLVPTEVVAGWHIGSDRWDEGTTLRYRLVRCSFH
jgi:hypothetical protein